MKLIAEEPGIIAQNKPEDGRNLSNQMIRLHFNKYPDRAGLKIYGALGQNGSYPPVYAIMLYVCLYILGIYIWRMCICKHNMNRNNKYNKIPFSFGKVGILCVCITNRICNWSSHHSVFEPSEPGVFGPLRVKIPEADAALPRLIPPCPRFSFTHALQSLTCYPEKLSENTNFWISWIRHQMDFTHWRWHSSLIQSATASIYGEFKVDEQVDMLKFELLML